MGLISRVSSRTYRKRMLLQFSCDSRFCAVQDNENLTVWNTLKYSSSTIAGNEATSFSWSPDGSLLAIGYRDGSIKILNVITSAVITEFQHISKSAIISLAFYEAGKTVLLLSLDSDSNLTVSNPEKKISKTQFYSANHFQSVSRILSITKSAETNTIFLLTASHVLYFSPNSGKFQEQKLPFQISNDTQHFHFSASKTQLCLLLDKHTLVKYRISKRNHLDFGYKKRFTSKITSLSACYDEKSIAVSFIDGAIHLLKSEGKNEIKVKVKLKNEVSPNKLLKADEKLHKASSALGLQSTSMKFMVIYGGSWTNPVFEGFDLAELVTLAKGGIVTLERTKSQNSSSLISDLSVRIQSVNVDVSTAGKRKRKDMVLKTIGESLDQRLTKNEGEGGETGESMSIYDKSTTMAQALHSDDSTVITSIIKESQSCPEIVQTTIASLAKDFIPSLLLSLEKELKFSPENSYLALSWLNCILKTQSSYLLTQKKDLVESMERIQELSKRKNRQYFILDELEGKLDYFLNNEDTVGEFQFDDDSQMLVPEFVYHADDDEAPGIEGSTDNDMEDSEADSGSEESDIQEDGSESEEQMTDIDDLPSKYKKVKTPTHMATPSSSENEEELEVI